MVAVTPPPLLAGSPGHVPHKCNSIKHRIISPKVDVRPCPFPALTEVQNISGSPEARAEADLAKGPLLDSKGPKPAKTGSPTMADAIPDSTQPSPALAQPGGFPKQERPPGTLSVSLPGSTIFVMAGPSGAEKPLALTPSQHLVSGEGGAAPTAPLGLAVLPGLVLSQSLESAMETNEGASDAFDPDRFLNSPKQGQTYGGGPGLQAEPEPTENAPAPSSGYSLYVSTNRFFIQDDGAGQGPTPLSASPTVAAAEAKSSTEAPMETAGEGDSRAEGLPGEGGGEAGGVPEISPKELQEELYSVIQRVAAAAPGGPFGLSFDSHFPDLISELMTEGTAADGAGSPNGPSPGSESPEPVLPEPLAEPCYAAEAVLGDSAQPLVSITDFSPEWSYQEVSAQLWGPEGPQRPGWRGRVGPSLTPAFSSWGGQGGVKVLITGPWMDDSESYSCLFDQISVPAALIQSGVLRCYCPGKGDESGGGGRGREGLLQPLPEQRATLPPPPTVLSPFLPQPTRRAWCRCKSLRTPACCPLRSCSSTGRGTSWRCPAPSWTGSPWTVSGGRAPPSCGQGTRWAFPCRTPTPHTGGSPPLTTVPFNDRSKSQ